MPTTTRMHRILILVWPEASAYNATLRLARLLRRRGDEVVYAVPERWATYLERQGFAILQHDAVMPVMAMQRARHSVRAADAEVNRCLADLQSTMKRLGSRSFDLILLQPTLWQHALVLRRLGILYVLANACLGSPWSPEIPPVFSPLLAVPAYPLANGVLCVAAWLGYRYLGAFSHRYRGILQPRCTRPWCRIRDAGVAARHLVRSVLEPLYMPVYYRALRVARREGIPIRWGDYGHRLVGRELVLGPKVVEAPRRRPRPHRVLVGACVDEERVEDAFDWSAVDPARRLVYCSVGSHGGHWNAENHTRLIRSVVEAFRALPGYAVLLQTCSAEEARHLEPLPENVLAAPWYPQLQVLARASLVITHGGFGTVREALFSGVPMIVFPHGVDQPGNAARVARLGVGLVGDIRSVTPASIRRMMRVIETPSYGENARRLSRELQADNTCSAALALIDRFLRSSRSQSAGPSRR